MIKMTDDQINITLGAWASKLGLGTVFFGWVTSIDLVAISGLVLGVAGFLVTWYYRHKQYKLEKYYKQKQDEREQEQAEREKREHDIRMGLLQ